ncbi:MAG: glycosyltransferase family 39 protein [Planctomycetota bacterium]
MIEPQSAEPPAGSPAVSRREAAAAAAIVLLGAVLRLWDVGSVAVEHFDEGVYASNIFFDEAEGGRYPFRFLYAPPLLPAAIEWCTVFLGPEGVAPFLPALACGTGLIAMTWRACRGWFGPPAGLTAAAFVAVDPFLILYSRTALTDVPVTFFIFAVVWAFERAVGLRTWKSLLLAGSLTGLAWWTKYNGWLPLAICGAGAAADVVWRFLRRDDSWRPWAGRVVKSWLVVTAVAVACFVPIVVGLQPHGGYAAVAENHRQYVVGFPGWIDAAGRQVANLKVLDPAFGPLIPMSLGIAGVVSAVLASRRSRLATWFVAAALIGLTVAVPLYTPYPRLLVTWRLTCWLGVAAGCGVLVGRFGRRVDIAVLILAVAWPITGLLTAASGATLVKVPNVAYDAEGNKAVGRRSMRVASEAILKIIEDDGFVTRAADAPARFIIYVYADPALFFGLAVGQDEGRYAVFPASDEDLDGFVDVPGVPTYLVFGPQAFWNHPYRLSGTDAVFGVLAGKRIALMSEFVTLNRPELPATFGDGTAEGDAVPVTRRSVAIASGGPIAVWRVHPSR